jgi:hypothetical protein
MIGAAGFLAAVAAGAITVLPQTAAHLDLAEYLRLLDEPPLHSWPNDLRTFRFLWVPPFESQRLVSVRVEDGMDGALIVAKAADRKNGVVDRLQRRLTPAEWDALAEAREHGFWKYYPQQYPQPVFDGAIWVLEGAAAGERLRIVQHVPSPGAFVDLLQDDVPPFASTLAG